MKRFPHYLKPTSGSALPDTCIVFDAELDLVQHHKFPGVQTDTVVKVNGKRWRYDKGKEGCTEEFESIKPTEFFRWLRVQVQKKKLVWLFGFAIKRQLTALGFFDLLEDGTWSLTHEDPYMPWTKESGKPKPWHGYMIAEDPPTVILCRPENWPGTLKIVDLANYGLTDYPSVPVGDPPIDRMSLWVKSIVRWIWENELGTLQNTAGSQAFYTFRRKYLTGLVECHTDTNALRLETEAFYGGRCEACYVGKIVPKEEAYKPGKTLFDQPIKVHEVGPLYHLDFNSLYPAVCVGAQLPVKLLSVTEETEAWKDDEPSEWSNAIATVLLDTPYPDYPQRTETAIYYPIGQFWTTLAGPELCRAMSAGHVKQVVASARYTLDDCLTHYMRDLYKWRIEARQSEDKPTEQLLKAMLVALPGKFAQQNRNWLKATGKKCLSPWDLWYEPQGVGLPFRRFRSMAWHIQYEERGDYHHESVPAIAAFVTSLARCALALAINVAGRGNVYYYDTDSIWTNKIGIQSLIADGYLDNSALGRLKTVATHDRVELRGIKHYVADGKLVCAGVPEYVQADANGVFAWQSVRKLHGDISRREAPQPVTVMRTVSYGREYTHGTVGPDGWVSPLRRSQFDADQQLLSLRNRSKTVDGKE